VTSSGLHVANRLASNSLIEGLVFGAICGRGASEAASRMPTTLTALPLKHTLPGEILTEPIDTSDVTNSLRSLMVRKMGIIRDRARLEEAQHDVDFWCKYVLMRDFKDRSGWELQNLLTVARLMIDAALTRTESRGTHFRGDFPNHNEPWSRKHVESQNTLK
jgi:L-aspartate oxidase